MENKFKRWTTVYGFTLRQSMTKSFKLITALVAILIIGIIIFINILAAKPEKDTNHNDFYMDQEIDTSGISPIKKALVMDQSGLQPTDFESINTDYYGNYFSNVEYISVENMTRSEILDAASKDSSQTVAVIISSTNGAYELEALIPYNSVVTREDTSSLIGVMMDSFSSNKINQSKLSQEELTAAFKPITSSFSKFGENSNIITDVIKILAPMLFGFILYFMLIFYGQTVSKSVSTEKTSKLMETLLTSIHPYAMITGKILAVSTLGVLQFLTWIMSGIVGLYTGNAIAHSIYPEYENSVITFINFIKDNIGQSGMTLPALILAILVFGVGFLFYCVLAALAGCLVSKPEDVASTQALYQFPVIINWLISYIAPVTGNNVLITAVRYFPLTAPFSVPADLIAGTIGLGEGLLSLMVLLIFSFVIIILSSKIYKGLVLYTGQKVSMKVISNILKS